MLAEHGSRPATVGRSTRSPPVRVTAATWADHYPPGATGMDGVDGASLRRRKRAATPTFDASPLQFMADPDDGCSGADGHEWIDKQGPVAPDLIDAIRANRPDLLVFTPYLYHPTVRGLPACATVAVLHPAAHDEPAIRLPLYRRGVRGGARPCLLHGRGAAISSRSGSRRRSPSRKWSSASASTRHQRRGAPRRAGLERRPYLLCLGRVDHSKGTRLLASLFARYKQRNPGPVALAVVGPVQRPVPAHPDIVEVGEVDDATKWALLRGASLLVSPSAFESFSLVLFESWEAGVPVLVNAGAARLCEHVVRSGGGLSFDSYAVFEAELDRLLVDDRLRQSLAAAGARYAEQYRWPAVIDRYRGFAERLASTLPADV